MASSAATVSTLFEGGVDGDPYFRSPALVVANDGSLLAFAGSLETWEDPAFDPAGDISVVVKRSTDGGATWSTSQTVWHGNNYDVTGIAPVVDKLTGEIILTFGRVPTYVPGHTFPTGTGSNTTQSLVVRSADNGQTWLPVKNVTTQVKDPNSQIFVSSPATGIQLRWQSDPSRNGRVLVPAFQADSVSAFDLAMFNDTPGSDTTWQAGALTPNNGISVTEADIVELVNGDLLMDARPNNSAIPRQRFISNDGGETWQQPYASDVVDPSVDIGLARYTAKRDGDDRNRLVYTAPLGVPAGANNSRFNLGLWTSYDEGKTFINPIQVGYEADGYSNVQALPGGGLAVTYETTDLYSPTPYIMTRNMFVSLDLLDLEGQHHQEQLTHYDGFGNQIDRLRGGMGWSGGWIGTATEVSAGQITFTGFRFPTEQGRVDLKNGQQIERTLATEIDLNTNSVSYISMLISQEYDTSSNSGSEFLNVELLDAGGTTQASFGVTSSEGFYTTGLGDGASTAPGLLDRSSSYFLVAKIVSEDDSDGANNDQIFLKVFKSGTHEIPDTEGGFSWTLTGGGNANSSAILKRIRIASGLNVNWSIDEIRIGNTYASVASNVTQALPGDLDGDGFVGISDLNIVLGNWNQSVEAGNALQGDPSGDAFVGIDDLNEVLGNWNAGIPPNASTIPEPTLSGIWVAMLLATSGSRRLRGR